MLTIVQCVGGKREPIVMCEVQLKRGADDKWAMIDCYVGHMCIRAWGKRLRCGICANGLCN